MLSVVLAALGLAVAIGAWVHPFSPDRPAQGPSSPAVPSPPYGSSAPPSHRSADPSPTASPGRSRPEEAEPSVPAACATITDELARVQCVRHQEALRIIDGIR